MNYIEYPTLKDAEDVSAAALQAQCRAAGKTYPEPLSDYVPGRWHQNAASFNAARPAELQRFLVAPIAFTETAQVGALLPVTPALLAVDGAKETIAGKQITLAVVSAQKDAAQLSAKAQAELQARSAKIDAVAADGASK